MNAKEYIRKSTVRDALKWMDQAIAAHERAAQDLKQYREQFAEAVGPEADRRGSATPVEVLSWFVNSASTSLNQNIYLSRAVSLGAALALTEKNVTVE